MAPAQANAEDSAKQCSQLFKSEDYKGALPHCQPAAEQGGAEAQHKLGEMYASGEVGLIQNWIEAERWYSKAADQGSASAIEALRRMGF